MRFRRVRGSSSGHSRRILPCALPRAGSWLALGLCWVGGVGCHSPGFFDFGGRAGLATGALYRHAESIVMARDRDAAPQCRNRSVRDTRLIEAPEAVADPHGGRDSVSFSGSGTPSSYVIPAERRYSQFVERWVIQRCDTEVVYRVTFTPSASGTDITAELETTRPSP